MTSQEQERGLELVAGGVVTVEEAAQQLRVCRATVYALMESGRLKSTKIGKLRRIPQRSIDELLARGLVEA